MMIDDEYTEDTVLVYFNDNEDNEGDIEEMQDHDLSQERLHLVTADDCHLDDSPLTSQKEVMTCNISQHQIGMKRPSNSESVQSTTPTGEPASKKKKKKKNREESAAQSSCQKQQRL